MNTGLSTVLTWLIAGGVVAILGALAFVYFKYLRGNSAAEGGVVIGGKVVTAIASVLPDDATKLDAHDIVLVLGRLLEAMPAWAKDPANVEFTDAKGEILEFIEQQRSTVPQLDKLPKGVIEKVAEALFMLTKALLSLKSA